MRFDKWFQLSEKLVRTICFKVRVPGEPVIYVINFSVWRNRGCTVAKKNTSTIWRKFFTEISVQMVSARCLVFSSSKNQEKKVKLATFHVVVVQWRQRNVQKNVMHVQSYCFSNQTCCFFAVLVAAVVVVAFN